jgi:hypothetical protein
MANKGTDPEPRNMYLEVSIIALIGFRMIIVLNFPSRLDKGKITVLAYIIS